MDRFKLIPAVYLVIRDGDRILMLQRKNTGYHDGDFSLPAGHVDGGEALAAAAAREAMEELGITVTDTDLRLAYVMHRRSEVPDNADERVDFYFEVSSWQGEASNMEPEKCSALEWFDVTNLPGNTVPTVRKALEAIAAGESYGDDGWKVS